MGRAVAAGLTVLSLVLLPLWIDYVRVLLNGRGPYATPLYSWKDLALVAVPLVAWLARTRGRGVEVAAERPSLAADPGLATASE